PILQTALTTSRLAQMSALSAHEVFRGERRINSFSELVYPWIKELIEAADEERRQAENLLLAADEAHWSQARVHFEAAAKSYGQARAEAATVRKALDTYYETWAWLPPYAQYLARSRSTTPQKLSDVIQLAEEVSRLADTLEKGYPRGQDLQ